MPILSVVVPSRNEADSVGMLISELEPVIEDSAELIFVDDSDDDTPARVLEHGRAARESVRLVHRVGVVKVNEPSLWVEVVAPHRGEAFAACQWLIDEMKRTVPIWKKAVTGAKAQHSWSA